MHSPFNLPLSSNGLVVGFFAAVASILYISRNFQVVPECSSSKKGGWVAGVIWMAELE